MSRYYIIDTEFGGGKTHIFKNEKLAKEYIRQYGLDEEYDILEAPQAKVVAIDCRRLRKNTYSCVPNWLRKMLRHTAAEPFHIFPLVSDMITLPVYILMILSY